MNKKYIWELTAIIMYNQSFSGKELYRLTTQVERRDFGLEKNGFIKSIDDEISSALLNRTYSFKFKVVNGLFLNGLSHTLPDERFTYLCQDLILRKIYQNIKKIYNVRQADRNKIVQQIQMLLDSKKDYWIIRLDVKSFYESLDRTAILNRLYKQYRLSPLTTLLLQKIFEVPIIKESTGIPRGLSISSCLSELAMKYFDIEIKQYTGVYYYARFVDDIIIFCATKECMDNLWCLIPKKLKELSLTINITKSKKISSKELKESDANSLIYLGYSFSLKETVKDGEKSNWVLYTDISHQKVDKIKTRITKSFVNVIKNGDVGLLRDRIKYLTGNYSIKNKQTLLPVKAGIYYNYKRIDSNSYQLKELDSFYQNILHCYHGKLGIKLSSKLTKNDREKLKKYSFKMGFSHHTFHSFTPDRIHEIKKCWL